MDQLLQNLGNWNQPQLLSLIVTVLICIVISLIIFIKIKIASRPDKAPSGFLIIIESYINFVDNQFDEATNGTIKKTRIYIFGLTTFLLIGNLLGPIGIEPIATSYSVPLTLGLITWLGIFVVGFIYQKFRFLKRYLNPVEVIGQFAPLISISFRMFGNIVGGGAIIFMLYYFTGYLWHLIPGQADHRWFFFAPLFAPALHLYFDIFDALIQTLVFATLTVIYWAKEAEVSTKPKKNKKNNVKTITTKQNIY